MIDKKVRFIYTWKLKFNKPIKDVIDISLGELIEARYVLDLIEFVNEYVK